MPIPGAAIRLGRCATGLAATFQATTCRAHGGCLAATPAAKAPPEDWPGLRQAKPAPTVPQLAYCAIAHTDPARLVVLSPTPVNGLVLSPTFCCGWTCAITHKPIVLSPTTTKKNTLIFNVLSNFSRGVTRARGFLTFKFFNVFNVFAA